MGFPTIDQRTVLFLPKASPKYSKRRASKSQSIVLCKASGTVTGFTPTMCACTHCLCVRSADLTGRAVTLTRPCSRCQEALRIGPPTDQAGHEEPSF